MSKMRVVQVSQPKGPFELVERNSGASCRSGTHQGRGMWHLAPSHWLPRSLSLASLLCGNPDLRSFIVCDAGHSLVPPNLQIVRI